MSEDLPLPCERIPFETKIHDGILEDPYHWLKERTNPKVVEYLESENKYQEEKLKPLEGLRQTIFEEFKNRIKQTDQSVPYRMKDYLYYSKVG